MILSAAALVASVAIGSGCAAQPAPPATRVLILYAPPPESPAIAAFSKRLRATLRGELRGRVEFYHEYLDLDRFASRERWPQLTRYFVEKYRGFRIDAIIAVGSAALHFATDPLSTLFPGVPVVLAVGLGSLIDIPALPANVTGRLAPVQFDSTLAMARRLQPDAQRVAIVAGLTPSDSGAVSSAVRAVRRLSDRMQLVMLQGLSYDSLLVELRRLPPRTIVLLAHFRRDARGQVFTTAEVVSSITRASAAPVYGHLSNWVGDGIVGGAVMRVDEEGEHTGRLVLRVLGRRPGEALPPFAVAASPFVADWRQLQRWGLSEQRLPAGTQLRFRNPSTWQRHRMEIVAALGLFAAQSALIALLLVERRRRRRAQRTVEDQAGYEQMIAELTTDAVRHASSERPGALEDALARIARYAGARAAALVEYPETPLRPPWRIIWTDTAVRANGNGFSWAKASAALDGDSRLDIALIADERPIGALELYGADPQRGWPERLIGRLDAAGELIAGAMARSRAARAVRRGEELNRAVLASLSTQIAILDRNGTIIRVNEAWRDVARRSGVDPGRDAFLGENYLEECQRAEERGSADAREVRLGIDAVLERRAWPYRYQYRCAPEHRWYELSVDRLEDFDGGAIVTHLDITSRRLAELQADETRQQIEHMGRVAMVAELATAVSHELRQPLAAIRANAEAGALLLRQAPPEVPEAMEIFMDIVVDDIRASEIIDNIRALLRKQDPTTKSVSVNEICRQAVHLLHRDAALRGTRLELALDPRAASVSGNAVQLQQVVLNLTLNALDAAATSAGNREVVVGTRAGSAEVEIFVRDSGRGLQPDVEKHLFESFFSTKAHGLGMGLVIARSIVERHHGRLRAENHSDGGAVFRVLLPVAGARPEVLGRGSEIEGPRSKVEGPTS